jgi:chromosome segregation ATPase
VRRAAAALALVGALALLAGCAAWSPRSGASEELLARADTLTGQGDHPGAISAYDEVMRRYADTPAAARARLVRDTLLTIQTLRRDLAARATELADTRRDLAARETELAARAAELARLQRDVSVRDAELNKLRAEIVARQADITRLASEAERLRADLDQLNRLDLRLEQSGAKRR